MAVNYDTPKVLATDLRDAANVLNAEADGMVNTDPNRAAALMVYVLLYRAEANALDP